MSWESINRIVELTGASARTVKKRCEGIEQRKEGNSILLDSKIALPLVYKLDEDDRPDPTKENALLSRERRKKTRIERLVLEGGLIPAEEVVHFCYDMTVTIRNKILSIVPKLRNRYPHIDADTMSDIDEYLRDTLTELADDGIPNPLRSKMSTHLSGVQTSPKIEDQRVGGS